MSRDALETERPPTPSTRSRKPRRPVPSAAPRRRRHRRSHPGGAHRPFARGRWLPGWRSRAWRRWRAPRWRRSTRWPRPPERPGPRRDTDVTGTGLRSARSVIAPARPMRSRIVGWRPSASSPSSDRAPDSWVVARASGTSMVGDPAPTAELGREAGDSSFRAAPEAQLQAGALLVRGGDETMPRRLDLVNLGAELGLETRIRGARPAARVSASVRTGSVASRGRWTRRRRRPHRAPRASRHGPTGSGTASGCPSASTKDRSRAGGSRLEGRVIQTRPSWKARLPPRASARSSTRSAAADRSLRRTSRRTSTAATTRTRAPRPAAGRRRAPRPTRTERAWWRPVPGRTARLRSPPARVHPGRGPLDVRPRR